MRDATRFRIKAFPEGEGYWRIDWMEKIQHNPAVNSEPLIKVFLTKLKSRGKPGSINPLSSYSLDTEHRKITEIGVGLLPLVWIGSVWQNGYRIDDGFACTTRTLRVDTALARPIKFSDSATPPLQGRLIPAFEYPLGAKSWEIIKNSPLMAIPVGDDPFGMLIPAIEVIRFYYIYSSSSARTLFYGKYDLLFREPECSQDTQAPHVTLKLSWFALHDDAWVLARYIASETMQRRAKKIHKWVQRSHLEKTPQKFLESVFPFDGVTTLKAEGMNIKGEDGRTRFLCTRLRNCTHPMPYSGVTILLEDKPADPGEIEIRQPIWLSTWPTGSDIDSLAYEHGQEPDRKIERMLLDASEERFSALVGMKLNKLYQAAEPKSGLCKKNKSDEKKTGLGTGEGSYGKSDLIPAEINQNVVPEDKRAPPTLVSFLKALEFLRDKGLKVTTIAIGEKAEPFGDETISYFQRNANTNRQWGVIRIESETKLRGFIVAKVCNPKGCAYVLEIERNPSTTEKFSILVIALSDFTDISPKEFNSLARNCELIGRWPPEGEMKKFKRETAMHRNLPDPNIGNRILEALKRIKLV